MGAWAKPYYGTETIMAQVEEIAKLDEKINELLIEREQYVETLKKAIEEAAAAENQA